MTQAQDPYRRPSGPPTGSSETRAVRWFPRVLALVAGLAVYVICGMAAYRLACGPAGGVCSLSPSTGKILGLAALGSLAFFAGLSCLPWSMKLLRFGFAGLCALAAFGYLLASIVL